MRERAGCRRSPGLRRPLAGRQARLARRLLIGRGGAANELPPSPQGGGMTAVGEIGVLKDWAISWAHSVHSIV